MRTSVRERATASRRAKYTPGSDGPFAAEGSGRDSVEIGRASFPSFGVAHADEMAQASVP